MASRAERRLPLLAVAVAVAVLALGAVRGMSWLTERPATISSTPVRVDESAPVTVHLPPGRKACLWPVTLDRTSQVAQLRFAQPPPPAATVQLGAQGPSYATRAVASARGGELDVPLGAPRRALVGRVCVSADRPIDLLGTGDPRARTRTTMTVDGQPSAQAFSLTFTEAARRTRLARVSQLVDRAAALSPLGPWAFWLALALVLLAVPALVLAALVLALRDPGPDAPPATKAV